jgi:hypothetical protein
MAAHQNSAIATGSAQLKQISLMRRVTPSSPR